MRLQRWRPGAGLFDPRHCCKPGADQQRPPGHRIVHQAAGRRSRYYSNGPTAAAHLPHQGMSRTARQGWARASEPSFGLMPPLATASRATKTDGQRGQHQNVNANKEPRRWAREPQANQQHTGSGRRRHKSDDKASRQRTGPPAAAPIPSARRAGCPARNWARDADARQQQGGAPAVGKPRHGAEFLRRVGGPSSRSD